MDEYLEFAKQLAKQAGKIMLDNFQIGIATETKDDNTPVTVADKAINKMVIESILNKYPEHGVLGEEDSSPKNDAEYIWVCDPIDGTIPYALGIPTSLFSLALVKNGTPAVAVLYDPQLDRMFEAIKSQGTKLNGKRMHVNTLASLENNYASLTGFQYGILDIEKIWPILINKKTRLMSFFCTTYESSLVTTGQAVASIFPGTAPWDVAATKLLVEEAGGKVTDLYGNEQRYDMPTNGYIASNGLVHDQPIELLADYIIKG